MKAKMYVRLIEMILSHLSIGFAGIFTVFWFQFSEIYCLLLGIYFLVTGVLFLFGLIEWSLNKKFGKRWQVDV
ncbi:MAG: hypothetical protein OH338_05135 [Candidatus Parvarchaeota archaeon]|nr:hypothetical protein [Candidatus Parvarchaeum tengchongense]